ncbi:hypothetical protein M758_12G110400, partial [Ceratodon purpureus]
MGPSSDLKIGHRCPDKSCSCARVRYVRSPNTFTSTLAAPGRVSLRSQRRNSLLNLPQRVEEYSEFEQLDLGRRRSWLLLLSRRRKSQGDRDLVFRLCALENSECRCCNGLIATMRVHQERFPAPRECRFLQPKSVREYADHAPGSTQFRVISQCRISSPVPESRMVSDTVRPTMGRSTKAVKIWRELEV